MKNIKLEKEIEEIISHSPVKSDPKHSKSTRGWVLKLKPDADYALQIAALAHDIDRGFEPDYFQKYKDKFKDYTGNRHNHSEQSAKIIKEILKKYNLSEEFLEKVYDLVLHHEFGGNEESDILKDADSISYFEGNLPTYLKNNGTENTKRKMEIMYNRMSDHAKNIVKKFKYYIPELNSMLKDIYGT